MPREISSILYASDLGPQSPAVLQQALTWAQRFQAKVHVVTVTLPWNPLPYEEFISSHELGEIQHAAHRNAETLLRQQIDEFDRDHPEFGIRQLLGSVTVLEGEPWRKILEQAMHVLADVIVMGSRSHSALGEFWLGSVAHRVTMKSDIPVLLVPTEH